ncbi:MAG: prolipoprotein diacylglyceryl transferase family protein [bacterium]
MFNYNPITEISFLSLRVNVWGLFLTAGFLAGLFLAFSLAKKNGQDGAEKGHLLNLSIIILILGIAGARMLYALENFSYFSHNFWEIFDLSTGGLSFFGGFLLSLAGAFLYLKKNKQNFWKFVDILSLSALLGMTFGRIGCFLAHDHLGEIMKNSFFLGVKLNGAVYHDPALYLLTTNAILFLISFYLYVKIKQRGWIFLIFLAGLGFSRLFWDFFRVDPIFWGLTVAQWITLPILVFSACLLISLIKQKNKLKL